MRAGFRQGVPLFAPAVANRLVDERGNFQLFRQIHPLTVPRLSFNGYNSSLFSPLSAEIAALWIADLPRGGLGLAAGEESLTAAR